MEHAIDRILSKGEVKQNERPRSEFESEERRIGLFRVLPLPRVRVLKPLPGLLEVRS